MQNNLCMDLTLIGSNGNMQIKFWYLNSELNKQK